MMILTEQMTIGELREIPELSKIRDMLFTHLDQEKLDSSIKDYDDHKCGIISSLNYAAERAAAGQFVYPLYPEASAEADAPESEQKKKEVCLIDYCVHPGKPYVLVIPGGGYNREWVLVEGHPLAQEINKRGFNAFVLIYRCGYFGCFPDALQDVAAAVKYIENNKEHFGVSTAGYAVQGSSAGGHLAAEWAVRDMGYGRFGCEKPGCVMLCYPGTGARVFYDGYYQLKAAGNEKAAAEAALYLKRMFGEDFESKDISGLDLKDQLSRDYPPLYLVHCQDDQTVPIVSSTQLRPVLEELGIDCELHFPEKGRHSFGIGYGTDAEGWMDQAAAFWKRHMDK